MSRWNLIRDALETPGPIVITSHVNPDGDALGSELALAAWLRRRGRTVHILNSDPVGERYAFLDPGGRCDTFDPARHDALLDAAGVIVILDVSRLDRIGRLAPGVAQSPAVTICIDHHVIDAEVPVAHALVDTGAAATGELIYDLIQDAGDPLDGEMAVALYVAIMTDTGSFRYSNTRAVTHRIVADLLRFPIDTAGIYEAVYGTSSAARLRLMGEVLAGMEIREQGRLVLLSVTQDAIRRTGATPGDTEGFVEVGRTLDTCRVVAVLSEHEGGEVKVSLRSRGTLDIGRSARNLGGGGHPQAAGALLVGALDEVRERVIAELRLALEDGGGAGPAAIDGAGAGPGPG